MVRPRLIGTWLSHSSKLRGLMAKKSAGLVMYRISSGALEVLLVHPGGPYWAKKDLGAWSVPKGEYTEEEDPFEAALREFEEELGFKPAGDFIPLTPIKQKSGKSVTAWAFEGDWDSGNVTSNTFTIEWPPRSGKMQEFPEVDRAEWFRLREARRRILSAQAKFLDELLDAVSDRATDVDESEDDRGGTEQGSLFE